MRERLAGSLEYVFSEVGEALGADEGAIGETVTQIRTQRQSPHRFGIYYDLVLALEADDVDGARDLARKLIAQRSVTDTQVGAIDDRPSDEAERYRRLLLAEIEVADAPETALMADCGERLAQAFALLDSGFPEMAAEIRALLREIVVAAGPEDPKALTFDGASSYMLWGAILLNARGQKTVLDTAQALAHESGHNLLFGFCASGPLVENADEELFSSPLRSDPRPMDGVVHATYVVARMHQTLNRLLKAEVLDEEQVASARADLALHRRNFEAGDKVIRTGARLTKVGRAMMEAAQEYMATAA